MGWRLLPVKCFSEYRREWDRLNHTLTGSHPLFDSRFVEPLLKHYGTDRDWLGIEDGADGIVSMVLLRREGGGIWTTFLPPPARISPILIGKVGSFKALLRELPFPVIRIDLLGQDPMCCPEWIFKLSPVEISCQATTMTIVTAGSFGEYWANRPRKLRNNAKRWAKKLNNEGVRPYVRKVLYVDAMAEALGTYARIERSGWKGREGSAIELTADQGRFFRETLCEFGATGEACAYELYVDNECVASRLLLRSNGMTIALKTTYDERYAGMAVGRVLLWTVIEDEFREAGNTRLEFYTNVSPDQAAWATETRETYHVSVYKGRIAKMLVNAVRWCRK